MNEAEHLTAEDREDLVAYLDGELDDLATQRLEIKLSQSPIARAEAETLKRSWGLLDFLPRPQVSQEFTNQTLDKLATLQLSAVRQTRRLRWLGSCGWAAGVALASVVGYWVMHQWPIASPPEAPAEDRRLMEHRESWHHYENVDSMEFLRALERSELFSEDS